MYIGSAGPSLGGQTQRQTASDRGRTGGTGKRTEPPREDRTKGGQRLSDSEKRTEGGPEGKPDRLTATLRVPSHGQADSGRSPGTGGRMGGLIFIDVHRFSNFQ